MSNPEWISTSIFRYTGERSIVFSGGVNNVNIGDIMSDIIHYNLYDRGQEQAVRKENGKNKCKKNRKYNREPIKILAQSQILCDG